ncbi:thioesterase II family protein [Singulisphaera acidiphila]|nr:alpha/beta fold hydrolase [Singulisphaera acidiphila]
MQANRATNPWLVRPRPNRLANFRLFCFPFAGGGASLFRLWPAQLPDWVELCAVQLPGRETRLREPIHRRIGPLIDELAEAIGTELDKPFVLFGHSMGALVAFELARELRRRNLPSPRLLIASGRIAPQLRPRRPPIHTLPEAEFREELRLLDGTPQALLDHSELMGLFSPIIRADLAVNATYAYTDEPPLDLPILALGGQTDPWVHQEELEGWRLQTNNAFEREQFLGGHFFLQTATAELLTVLSRSLTTLQGLPA